MLNAASSSQFSPFDIQFLKIFVATVISYAFFAVALSMMFFCNIAVIVCMRLATFIV